VINTRRLTLKCPKLPKANSLLSSLTLHPNSSAACFTEKQIWPLAVSEILSNSSPLSQTQLTKLVSLEFTLVHKNDEKTQQPIYDF
jgi:hypothetical protein